LEFAKNIPKPVWQNKIKKQETVNLEQNQEFKDELQLLEQQHLKLLNEIEVLNTGKKI